MPIMKRKKIKTVREILQVLDQQAPLGCAEEWDNVGLLVGDLKWETEGAIVSVDLTQEAVDLAVKKGYRLIVNHHPCIFPRSGGLSQIVAGSPIFSALENGIAVAAYHTNFDQCALEVVEKVSEGLKVDVKGRLIEKPNRALKKLVVYVPTPQLESLTEALFEAGAGHVGNYDSCSFSSDGFGTFRGGESTQPALGKPGEFERVQESRLEVIFPKGLQSQVLRALKENHPYEEVAYDLYSPEQKASGLGVSRGLGYGFWGEFRVPRAFSDLAKDVKNIFGIQGFWITNPAPSQVSRIGFVAGKGASFLDAAAAAQCDVLITGEAGYHSSLMASRKGVSVMELGHRESERFFIQVMRDWLSAEGLQVIEVHTPTQQIWSGGIT